MIKSKKRQFILVTDIIKPRSVFVKRFNVKVGDKILFEHIRLIDYESNCYIDKVTIVSYRSAHMENVSENFLKNNIKTAIKYKEL